MLLILLRKEKLLPKFDPTDREWNKLANGRSHLFMLCNGRKQYNYSNPKQNKIRISTGTDFLRINVNCDRCDEGFGELHS